MLDGFSFYVLLFLAFIAASAHEWGLLLAGAVVVTLAVLLGTVISRLVAATEKRARPESLLEAGEPEVESPMS